MTQMDDMLAELTSRIGDVQAFSFALARSSAGIPAFLNLNHDGSLKVAIEDTDVGLSTETTLSEVNGHVHSMDGRVLSSYAGSAYAKATAAPLLLVKATAGTLNRCKAYSSSTSLMYLQIHNVGTLTGGETPFDVIGEVAPGATVVVDYPYEMSTAIMLALSTTRDTYTAPGNVGYFHAWRD